MRIAAGVGKSTQKTLRMNWPRFVLRVRKSRVSSEELGNEQHVRRSAEESLNQLVQAKEKIEKNLRAVTKKKANEKTSQQTKIQNLKGEIEKMLVHQKSLESMLVAVLKKNLRRRRRHCRHSHGKFEQAISHSKQKP